VSALESLQFSAIGVIADINRCVTLDLKVPGDRLYIIGETRNECGASEYYDRFGYVGCRCPSRRSPISCPATGPARWP
jgi:phosphoribosylformylglycinamidine synthase subunit PurSL